MRDERARAGSVHGGERVSGRRCAVGAAVGHRRCCRLSDWQIIERSQSSKFFFACPAPNLNVHLPDLATSYLAHWLSPHGHTHTHANTHTHEQRANSRGAAVVAAAAQGARAPKPPLKQGARREALAFGTRALPALLLSALLLLPALPALLLLRAGHERRT